MGTFGPEKNYRENWEKGSGGWQSLGGPFRGSLSGTSPVSKIQGNQRGVEILRAFYQLSLLNFFASNTACVLSYSGFFRH